MTALKTKLLKIKTLSERGEAGERENARRMLRALLTKHGLTEADLTTVPRASSTILTRLRQEQTKRQHLWDSVHVGDWVNIEFGSGRIDAVIVSKGANELQWSSRTMTNMYESKLSWSWRNAKHLGHGRKKRWHFPWTAPYHTPNAWTWGDIWQACVQGAIRRDY